MAAFRFCTFFIFLVLGISHCKSLTFDEAKNNGKLEVRQFHHTKTNAKEVPADGISLRIFCHDGLEKVLIDRLKQMFRTVKLKINISDGAEYRIYTGVNESHVWDQHDTAGWNLFAIWDKRSISMAPFNKTCVGINTSEKYSVSFIISNADPWLLLSLLVGVVLFFIAGTLSKNILFYYGTGLSVGMLASFIILLFVMSRFLPWKKGAYAVMLGGWAVMGWAAMQVWENVQQILQDYYQYVLGYFITTGLISFAYLYYRGPVSDPRAVNLIKWTIQFVACILIYNSTQVPAASISLVMGALTLHNFPIFILHGVTKFFQMRFPRKRRLLTSEEYEEQASIHTKKALDELREYCRSPDCDAWKTISRIKTPTRFAKWVEGSPHMSDEELDIYDSDPHMSYPSITDDEDEIDFRLNSL